MRCYACPVMYFYRTYVCMYACVRAWMGVRTILRHTSAPTEDKFRLPGAVMANHRNQNSHPPLPPSKNCPYPACGGTEPSQRCRSLGGTWSVGCVDRPHHVMWCVGAWVRGCSMPDQAAVCRSLLLPQTQQRHGARYRYRTHRTTECSKVWPWERVRPAASGRRPEGRVPSCFRSRWRLWKLSQAPL